MYYMHPVDGGLDFAWLLLPSASNVVHKLYIGKNVWVPICIIQQNKTNNNKK